MKYSQPRHCRGAEYQKQQHIDAYSYYTGQKKASVFPSCYTIENI